MMSLLVLASEPSFLCDEEGGGSDRADRSDPLNMEEEVLLGEEAFDMVLISQSLRNELTSMCSLFALCERTNNEQRQ